MGEQAEGTKRRRKKSADLDDAMMRFHPSSSIFIWISPIWMKNCWNISQSKESFYVECFFLEVKDAQIYLERLSGVLEDVSFLADDGAKSHLVKRM